MISMKNEVVQAKYSDYENIRKLWAETFKEDSDAWQDWYFKYIYHPENVFLIYHDQKLVSMAHFNPYYVSINSKIVKSVSLAGVATEKSSRNKGLAKDIIIHGMRKMRKSGAAFSFLYPFNYDFYRKYGYEKCYDQFLYLEDSINTEYVAKISTDIKSTLNSYNSFVQSLNGFVVRDEEYQKAKIYENIADRNPVLAIEHNGKEIGYALAEEKPDKIIISELACTNNKKAARAIVKLFGKSAEYASPYVDSDTLREVKPHCMGRILDVVGVFDGAKAKDGKLNIKVLDKTISQNNTTFVFQAKNNVLNVTKKEVKYDISIDIKELALAAVGYDKNLSVSAQLFVDTFFDARQPWILEIL